MNTRTTTITLFIIIGLAAALLLSSCAKQAEAPSPAPAPAPAPVEAPKPVEAAPAPVEAPKPAVDDSIKIGFLGPLTGNAATLGNPIKDAVGMAYDDAVNGGLLNGKKVTIIYEDDACDPKLSSTAFTKLATVDKVAAAIGPLCSGPLFADAPIALANKVVMLSYGATNPKIKDAGDYIFRNVPSDANQGKEGALIMKGFGVEKASIIFIQNDWGAGLKDAFILEAKKQGITILATETYDPASTDLRTQAAKAINAKPDAIYMLSFPADAGLVIKQLRELGYKGPIVGGDATKDDAVIKTARKAAEGLIVTLPGVPTSPQLEAFASAYKTKTGKDYSAYTPEGYDAATIILKACGATTCTSDTIKDYLYSMGEYKGASGTYAFDKDGEVSKGYDRFMVLNGTWAPYNIGKPESSPENQ